MSNNKKRTSKSEKEYQNLFSKSVEKIKQIHEELGGDVSMKMFEQVLDKVKPFDNLSTKERNEAKQFMTEFTDPDNLNYQFEKNERGLLETKATLNEIRENTRKSQELTIQNFIDKGVVNEDDLKGLSFEEKKDKLKNNKLAGLQIPSDFNFDSFSRTSMIEARASRMKERSEQNFYDSFTASLKQNHINKMLEIYNSDADDYVEKLRNMRDKDFYGFYQTTGGDVFDLPYKADGSDDYMAMLEDIESQLDTYINDEDIKLLNDVEERW